MSLIMTKGHIQEREMKKGEILTEGTNEEVIFENIQMYRNKVINNVSKSGNKHLTLYYIK